MLVRQPAAGRTRLALGQAGTGRAAEPRLWQRRPRSAPPLLGSGADVAVSAGHPGSEWITGCGTDTQWAAARLAQRRDQRSNTPRSPAGTPAAVRRTVATQHRGEDRKSV